MNERTDNLKVIFIDDKSSFVRECLDGHQDLNNALSVDVCGRGVDFLSNLSAVDVLSQCSNKQYVWLLKIHE